jgi:hypothetical protein
MTSLHQRLNQENVHEREGAVEALQSRWSSTSVRAIVDKPPSHPPTRRQMGGKSSSGSLKESHHQVPDTGDPRRGSPGGRFQWSNSKWDSSTGDITDSPPLQPLSCRRRESLLKPRLARHRPRRSFTRGVNYPRLLQTLIVQGLLRIEENDEIDEENEVTVFCRGEDEATVKKVLPAAVKEYAEIMQWESTFLLEPVEATVKKILPAAVKEYADIMQWESTFLLEPVVSVNDDGTKDLSDKSYGGIALTDDRLFHLNQTIDN